MTGFETEFFQPFDFTQDQLERHWHSARRDLDIAVKTDIAEVRFKFAYEAFIKLGIVLIAKQGYKVRSRFGHHYKIIEKMGSLLESEDVLILGNKMRQERNADFYDGGVLITDADSGEYLEFVINLFGRYGN